MTTPQPVKARLLALLADEAAQLRSFVALLGQEESLLVDGQTDALMSLAREKTEQYRKLQRFNDDRLHLLAQIGLRATDDAIRQVCGQSADAAAPWDTVLELAREAQARNQRNGKLIAERMQHNQAALTTLLAAADQPQLYGADGQSRPTGGGRKLGSA
ncbi:flagellar protein FlgN [Nitrogeniibacter mangrovi]|uniref:Flagellar protein FlgN n=1 Tax=Nitrogeniibacter mangrovi TaxID=2016596 RepID=A0A6C1B6H0_9RHOO|nr:flagellar protein FlgN [Nitrogeniibacter mangrovi]QID18385.1 flagellar protein FlgN [Nitrogeniibacter mangrovi]